MRKSLFNLLLLVCLIPAAAFAANGEQEREASYYLWRLVNEARTAPLNALEGAGISEASAREALGEWEWVLDRGLPPVAWNELLYASASGHVNDMVSRVYYSRISPEGTDPAERIRAAGLDALETGESLGILAFNNYIPPLDAARAVFQQMLTDELNPARPLTKTIFHPYLTHAGIACQAATLDLRPDMPVNVYLTVADLALPADDRPFLVGNVYWKGDGAVSWNLENGAPGMVISLGEPGPPDSAAASRALGAYQVPVPDAFFLVTVRDPAGNIMGRWICFGGGGNRLLDLGLTR